MEHSIHLSNISHPPLPLADYPPSFVLGCCWTAAASGAAGTSRASLADSGPAWRRGHPGAARAVSDLGAADLQATDEDARVPPGPADGARTGSAGYRLGGGGTVEALSLPQQLASAGGGRGGGGVQAREAGDGGAEVHPLLSGAAAEQALQERSVLRGAGGGGEGWGGGAVEEGGGRSRRSGTGVLGGAAAVPPLPQLR